MSHLILTLRWALALVVAVLAFLVALFIPIAALGYVAVNEHLAGSSLAFLAGFVHSSVSMGTTLAAVWAGASTLPSDQRRRGVVVLSLATVLFTLHSVVTHAVGFMTIADITGNGVGLLWVWKFVWLKLDKPSAELSEPQSPQAPVVRAIVQRPTASGRTAGFGKRR